MTTEVQNAISPFSSLGTARPKQVSILDIHLPRIPVIPCVSTIAKKTSYMIYKSLVSFSEEHPFRKSHIV